MAISFEYFLDMELLGQIFCKTLRLLACIAYPESAPNCTPVSGRYMSIPLSGILADVIMFLNIICFMLIFLHEGTEKMNNQLLHEETTNSETYFCLSFLTNKREY